MKICLINFYLLGFSFAFIINAIKAQTEGGLWNKLIMMMMKNRRRQYVPFAISFNPMSYSGLNPYNLPNTGFSIPIGSYPNYGRSNLLGSINTLAPLTGINPLSLNMIPFFSGIRNEKFLSRSSPMYEPTITSSNLIPQYTAPIVQPVSPPIATSVVTPLVSSLPTANALIANPAAVTNSFINSLSDPFNSIPITTVTNSPLVTSFTSDHNFQITSTPPTNFPSSSYIYSYNATHGNTLTDKTMSGSQGELIKQELREHHLNNIRIQYLKNLRDHLIKDQKLREQYLNKIQKKKLPFTNLDLYEEN